MNDNTAILVLKAASIVGLRIPDDLSVMGFDDMDMAPYVVPSLTTVAQDSFAIGKRAAELLIERVEGWYSGAARSERISTRLRMRASTSVTSVSIPNTC
jgi:DNA-binding LacI/PurR family transcriptional regulator